MQLQFRTGKSTFLLDGRVVEYFYEGSSTSMRFHVDFFRVDGKPKGSDLKIKFGLESFGMITNGGSETIPAAQIAEFEAFTAAARAART